MHLFNESVWLQRHQLVKDAWILDGIEFYVASMKASIKCFSPWKLPSPEVPIFYKLEALINCKVLHYEQAGKTGGVTTIWTVPVSLYASQLCSWGCCAHQGIGVEQP